MTAEERSICPRVSNPHCIVAASLYLPPRTHLTLFRKCRAQGPGILPGERSGGTLRGRVKNRHLLSLGGCIDRNAGTLWGEVIGELRWGSVNVLELMFRCSSVR